MSGNENDTPQPHEAAMNTVVKEEQEQQQQEEVEEEEDVPPNFFDDFLTDDFMDGLDVVDACGAEEDDVRATSNLEGKRTDGKSPKTKPSPASRDRKHPRIRIRDLRDQIQSRKPRPNHSRSPNTKRKRRSLTDERKDRDSDKDDMRRDPEKTRRDIQRDKDKCIKYEEARIISEKLKVVETGLVPPGTEMDVDIASLAATTTTTTTSKPREKRSRSAKRRSPVRTKRPSPAANVFDLGASSAGKGDMGAHKGPGGGRNHRRKRSISRRRSPPRRSRSIDFSRRRARRDMSRSPLRPRRSPLSFSPIRRRYSSERGAKMRERSPLSAQRQTKRDLPGNNNNNNAGALPERDVWSIESANPLNHVNAAFVPYVAPAPYGAQAPPLQYNHQPVPFPAPNNYYPAQAPAPEPIHYQANFGPQPAYNNSNQAFMGAVPLMHHESYPAMQFEPPNLNQNYANTQFAHATQPINAPAPVPPAQNSFQTMIFPPKGSASMDTATKLYESKKISLSDYLTMTTKDSGAGKPVNLTKKISVIALCQDAINMLTNTQKLRGRFFMKKLQSKMIEPNFEHDQWKSPLKKKFAVRFSFTTNKNRISPMQDMLRKIQLGLKLVNSATPHTAQPEMVPPPAPTISIRRDIIVPTPIKQKVTVATQTTFASCHACEVRKLKRFLDKEVECKPSMSFGMTQVNEDELLQCSELSQHESLARLTPAQILGRNMDKYGHSMEVDIMSLKSKAAIFSQKPNRGASFSRPPRTQYAPLGRGYSNPSGTRFDLSQQQQQQQPQRHTDFFDYTYPKF